MIDAIAHGGTSAVTYPSALVLMGLYLVVALSAAAALFRRRDVAK